MHWTVRIFILIIGGLPICFSSSLTVVAQAPTDTSQVVQRKRPLTFKQIEALLKGTATAKPTPDGIIAQEILERSVDFQVDALMLERLAEMGAGPQTLDSLRNLRNQVSRLGTTTVLIADFKGLNGEDIGLTDIFSDKLTDAVSKYRDVKVLHLGTSITATHGGREAALEKGRELNASIVLWGWFVRSPEKILVTVNFEVMKSPHSVVVSSEKGSYHAALSTLNEFTLQGELSKELTTIILAATALTRLDVGDYGAAINRLNQAMESHVSPQMVMGSDDIFFYSCLAYILAATADEAAVKFLPQVITNLEQHIKVRGQSSVAFEVLSLAYLVSEKYDKASESAQKLLEAESNPRMQRVAYHVLMYVAELTGDHQNKIQYAKRVIKLNEDLAAPDFERVGDAYMLLKDDKAALTNFQKALGQTTDPKTLARLHVSKARIYYEKDSDLDEALNELKQALELDPRILEAHLKIGNIYYWRQQYLPAIQHYSRAIRLKPKSALAYSNRANAYRDSGRVAEALQDYETALRIDPLDAQPYVERGNLYLDENQRDKALRDLDEGLKLEPDNTDALYTRAAIYARNKKYDASIADYNTIIKIRPSEAVAYFYRGLVLKDRDGNGNGLADFDAAIKLSPNYVEVYLERSLIYASKGDVQKARADLTTVLQLSKDPYTRLQARQRLKQLAPKKVRAKQHHSLSAPSTTNDWTGGDIQRLHNMCAVFLLPSG